MINFRSFRGCKFDNIKEVIAQLDQDETKHIITKLNAKGGLSISDLEKLGYAT